MKHEAYYCLCGAALVVRGPRLRGWWAARKTFMDMHAEPPCGKTDRATCSRRRKEAEDVQKQDSSRGVRTA